MFALAGRSILLGVGILLAAGLFALAQQPSGPKPKRVQPPAFTPGQAEGIFFPNLFEGGLSGARPSDFGASAGGSAVASIPGGGTAPAARGAAPNGKGWGGIISADSLQDEVTSIKRSIDMHVTTPTAFAGGGYKEVRRDATMLALLFGIIAEYDEDVRWKNNAAAARELFGRLGYNTKVGSQAAYNEAKARKTDLQDLLSGGATLQAPAGEPSAWDKIADRPPLMQRLDIAEKQRIGPAAGNAAEFSKGGDELLREAELVAAIAQVIGHESYLYADDKEYQEQAQALKAGAMKLADAIRQKNHEAGRAAAGEISKSCTECHELYRG